MMKIPMTLDLRVDYSGSKRKLLQDLIDLHGYSRDSSGDCVYCKADDGILFRVFRVSHEGLWHIA